MPKCRVVKITVQIPYDGEAKLQGAFEQHLHACLAGCKFDEDRKFAEKSLDRAERFGDPDRTELAIFLMRRAGFGSVRGGNPIIAYDFED
jgi:hypothetical protein